MNKEEQKKILAEIMQEDEKLGLYKKQTAVEWLVELIKKSSEDGDLDFIIWSLKNNIKQAKTMEKEQIMNAMMHALDEDGHTGDWKIKFVNDYYNKTYKAN